MRREPGEREKINHLDVVNITADEVPVAAPALARGPRVRARCYAQGQKARLDPRGIRGGGVLGFVFVESDVNLECVGEQEARAFFLPPGSSARDLGVLRLPSGT